MLQLPAALLVVSLPIAQPVPLADGQAGHFDLGTNGGLDGTGVGEGWYSYNLGSWHLISLNIECSTQQPGGCPALGAEPSTGTWLAAELAWLKKDLAGEPCPLHSRVLASAHVQRY